MECDNAEDRSLRRSQELKKALKRYNRKKKLREAIFWVLVGCACAVPYMSAFTRTEALVWFGFILLTGLFEQHRKRIRAMQLRLATMKDQLDHLAGQDISLENVLLELSEA